MTGILQRPRALAIVAVAFAAVVIVALVAVWPGQSGVRITAYFRAAVGVYPGSDVRVLGVKVGQIDSIRPKGTQVVVRMTLDPDVKVPADAKLVVIAPSLVADRYIQLTPAYTGGPALTGTGSRPAVITPDRTVTPLEVNQLYDSVRKLANDLGPDGKLNSKGALSKALDTGAANLAGNGKKLNNTIADFGKAARTLSGSSDDLFATISNLQKFTGMLARNDGQIRRAENQLAQVSEFLAADRDELAAGLHNLAVALGQVKEFIAGNRKLIKSNVDKLAAITQTLVDQRASLAEALDIAPLVAGNALNAYDPATRSLMSRGNLLEITAAYGGPNRVIGPGGGGSRFLCATAAAAVKSLCGDDGLGRTAGVGSPALPLPPTGPVYERSDGAQR